MGPTVETVEDAPGTAAYPLLQEAAETIGPEPEAASPMQTESELNALYSGARRDAPPAPASGRRSPAKPDARSPREAPQGALEFVRSELLAHEEIMERILRREGVVSESSPELNTVRLHRAAREALEVYEATFAPQAQPL